MRSPPRSGALLLAALSSLLASCGDGNLLLVVDLRTDMLAGREFTAVRTEALSTSGAGAALYARDIPAFAGQSYLEGLRIAEIPLPGPDTLSLEVSLLDEDGLVILSREVLVAIRASTAVTVLMTRDCRGVECPGAGDAPAATACLGGRCVDPRCSPETPGYCGPVACEMDSDCIPSADCATGSCNADVCWQRPSDDACGDGELCDPDVGCVGCEPGTCVEPDAGLAGDAGADRDAGTHACGAPGTPCCAGDLCEPGASCESGTCTSCGGPSEPCCAGGACGAGATCAAGTCTSCGGPSEPCCAGGACGARATCQAGTCTSCGARGEPCCAGACDADAVCTAGTCAPCGGETQPCCADGSCLSGTCAAGTCPVCQWLPVTSCGGCTDGCNSCAGTRTERNTCTGAERPASCVRPAPVPCCGNDSCEGGESCGSCPVDCGCCGACELRGGNCDRSPPCGSPCNRMYEEWCPNRFNCTQMLPTGTVDCWPESISGCC